MPCLCEAPDHVTDLVEQTISLDGRELTLLRPREPEALIDEDAFAEDEFLPYWAELWPSAHALTEVLLERDLRGMRVLELGCGLGLPSLAAALAGADVTATDWAPDAVDLLRDNARRNGLSVRTEVWRWSDPPERLGPPWPLVYGSDLLYEKRNERWLSAALDSLVAAGGEALIADPGRMAAESFLETLEPVAPSVFRRGSASRG
jgi:predicted nicotinamide N-methyase